MEKSYVIGIFNNGELIYSIKEFKLDSEYERIIEIITSLISKEHEKNPFLKEGNYIAWDRLPLHQ